jgi:Domain of unknown function (DU1801)
MAPKTTPTDQDVGAFLAAIPDDQRRRDSERICRLMAEETGEPARMWGTGIVGFGSYRYTYASGREGDWMALGFAPRKQHLVLYLMDGFADYEALLARLGRHSTGKACLYVKRLDDVDLDVLRELVRRSYAHTATRVAAG